MMRQAPRPMVPSVPATFLLNFVVIKPKNKNIAMGMTKIANK